MDITSVCKRYFKQCLEGLQVAHLAGKASEYQSCMEKHLIILGTFLKKNKIDGCNFVERQTWLVWHNWAIWVSFHPFFSPKASPSPGGSASVAWPRGDALGCGHWAPKHPGKRCSKGRGALHWLEWWHKGWEFVRWGLPSPRPCCCCSPGMTFCGFLSAAGCPSAWFASVGEELILAQGCSWCIWKFQHTLNFVTNCCSNSVWRQHSSHAWWEGTKLIFLFSFFEHFF